MLLRRYNFVVWILAGFAFSHATYAQEVTPKTDIRFSCTCGDTLTDHIVDETRNLLARDSQYKEAPPKTYAAWEVSIDSTVAGKTGGLPVSIAISVVVTRDGRLIDNWADFCTKDESDSCSEDILKSVRRDITKKTQADDDAAAAAEAAAGPISRPNTGDNIIPPVGPIGKGILKLSCSIQLDSLVIVTDASEQIVRAVYVRANQTATVIPGLPPGIYSVRVGQGNHFHGKTMTFTPHADYFKFPHVYTFTETDTGESIIFKELSLTLNSVSNGNIVPVPISAAEFWKNVTQQTHIQY